MLIQPYDYNFLCLFIALKYFFFFKREYVSLHEGQESRHKWKKNIFRQFVFAEYAITG